MTKITKTFLFCFLIVCWPNLRRLVPLTGQYIFWIFSSMYVSSDSTVFQVCSLDPRYEVTGNTLKGLRDFVWKKCWFAIFKVNVKLLLFLRRLSVLYLLTSRFFCNQIYVNGIPLQAERPWKKYWIATFNVTAKVQRFNQWFVGLYLVHHWAVCDQTWNVYASSRAVV